MFIDQSEGRTEIRGVSLSPNFAFLKHIKLKLWLLKSLVSNYQKWTKVDPAIENNERVLLGNVDFRVLTNQKTELELVDTRNKNRLEVIKPYCAFSLNSSDRYCTKP